MDPIIEENTLKKLTPVLVAGALAASMLAACSPAVLQAALQAAKAEGQGGSPAPGASPVTGATTAPTAAASAGVGVGASTAPGASAEVAAAVKAYMAAVDAASAQEPEKVARLFVTGLVTYDLDKKLGRAMMGYALRSGLVQQTASSPTGVEPQVVDEIYFRTLDRNTKLGSYYLDAAASAALPWDQMAAKVAIDKEYKAIDQGLSEDGKMWTFYIKVTGAPTEVRSRPVRLQQDGDRGWRISNYSSLMVQP